MRFDQKDYRSALDTVAHRDAHLTLHVPIPRRENVDFVDFSSRSALTRAYVNISDTRNSILSS